jgi:hypothetical protein
MDDTEQAGNDGSIISAKYWSNIIIAGNMGEKRPFTRRYIVISIVDANPVSGPMSHYPSPVQHIRHRKHAISRTHRYAGGRAKIRLIKRMARQDWPRLSPKAVGPRVPKENLTKTPNQTSSSTRLANVTASEGILRTSRW